MAKKKKATDGEAVPWGELPPSVDALAERAMAEGLFHNSEDLTNPALKNMVKATSASSFMKELIFALASNPAVCTGTAHDAAKIIRLARLIQETFLADV